MYQWFFLLVVLPGLGCGTRNKIPDAQPAQTVVAEPADSILLLTFTLFRDTTIANHERIELTRRGAVAGRLKQPLKAPDYVSEGDLICSFYNRAGKVVFVYVEEDPLTTPMEYPNDDGSFGRANIGLEKAELFIRVQASPDLDRLIINKVMPAQRIVQLAEFKL